MRFIREAAAEQMKKGFVKVGEILKVPAKSMEAIPKPVRVFMLALTGGSVLAGCSTEMPGMAPKGDVKQALSKERPGIEQVGTEYTKEVKELIAGKPLYEVKNGLKSKAKVFAKNINVDGVDRVLVHVEANTYEGDKGDTQYVGLLDSFGTQDESAQGYLSLHLSSLENARKEATGSKSVVAPMDYLVDAADVEQDGVELFVSRDSSSILKDVLALQDSGVLKKMPTDKVFLSLEGSKQKTHNYEIRPGGLEECKSFFSRINDDGERAEAFGTTRIALHRGPDARLWAGAPVEELFDEPVELQP